MGAQIVDELTPREGEHLVVKKGFGGFANTQLDTILRNMAVNTCVVSGVTTCVWFEPQRCDLFVTEATFGLPVFRHPPDTHEIGKLLHSVRLFPERCHLVGVYALGKMPAADRAAARRRIR